MTTADDGTSLARYPIGGSSPPVRIFFVGTTSRMSGVEFSTMYLVQWIDRSAWDAMVVSPEEGDLTARCRESGVRYAVLPLPGFKSVGLRIAGFTLPNPFAFVWNAGVLLIGTLRLFRFLRKERPKLVVTKGMEAHFYGGAASCLAGIPCVWHVQDRVSERLGKLYPLFLSAACRLLANKAIADAESVAEQLKIVAPAEHIRVVLNGVDTQAFSPEVDGSRVRHEWSDSRDEILVGIVARITPWKGQHLLLQACARLQAKFPNLRAVIVGTPMFDNDRYLFRLKDIVRSNGLEHAVTFAGFRWDLPEVFAAFDIVAHTSVEKDSSPLSLVSAMASGRAIVCANIPGTAELLLDRSSALLFRPGDAVDLSAKLEELLASADLRARLGRAARETALNELSLERFARRCEEVFVAALAE